MEILKLINTKIRKSYSIKDIIDSDGAIAVRARTYEEYSKLMRNFKRYISKELDATHNAPANRYNDYKDATCLVVEINKNRISTADYLILYGDYEFCLSEGYRIIEYKDVMLLYTGD